MYLETERLILREMNIDDYDSLYRVLADVDIISVQINNAWGMPRRLQLL